LTSRRWATLLPLGALALASVATTLFDRETPGRLNPELSWSGPSWARPFGCGEAGVDLLALVSAAERRALLLAVVVGLVGFAAGTALGAAAALVRGGVERFVERICDFVQSFPTFIMALAVLSAVRTPSRIAIGFVFAATAWAPFARLSLAQTRSLRTALFVEAASALGRSPAGVFLRHIIPNLLGVAAVQLGSTAAAVVVGEASLAFVGLGPPNGVSLGGVLDQGVAAMLRAPHVLLVGALSVFATSGGLLIAGRVFHAAPSPR
jgi:peptide/nickel transport system permease protein